MIMHQCIGLHGHPVDGWYKTGPFLKWGDYLPTQNYPTGEIVNSCILREGKGGGRGGLMWKEKESSFYLFVYFFRRQ